MTDSLTELMDTRPTETEREQAANILARLTPREQWDILVSVYATACKNDGSGFDRHLAASVKETVYLRTRVPGYREAVAKSGRRAEERLSA